MKLNHALAATNPNFVVVHASFPRTSNTYSYKCPDLDAKVGDFFIVLTSSGYQVVEVRNVSPAVDLDLDVNYEYKWTVQKVDPTWYDAVMQAEKDVIKEIKRAETVGKATEFISELRASAPAVGVALDKYSAVSARRDWVADSAVTVSTASTDTAGK